NASWRRLQDRLRRQRAAVSSYLEPLEGRSTKMREQQEKWEATIDAMEPSVPADLKSRAIAASEGLSQARAASDERIAEAVAVSGRVTALLDTATALSEATTRGLRERLWSRDGRPIWELIAERDDEESLSEALAAGATSRLSGLGAYIKA